MWLVHKPTGKMCLLAKESGLGWIEYSGPRHEPFYSLQGLLTEVGYNANTAFEIEYEVKPK